MCKFQPGKDFSKVLPWKSGKIKEKQAKQRRNQTNRYGKGKTIHTVYSTTRPKEQILTTFKTRKANKQPFK